METIHPPVEPSLPVDPPAGSGPRPFEFKPFVFSPLPPTQPVKQAPPRRRRRFFVFLAVAAVFAAGVGIGIVAGPESTVLQEAALPATAQAIAPTAGTTPPPPTITPSTTAPPPAAVTAPADEPIAVVAASLTPAMVQIDTASGLGSGFIYDPDGLILTAAHVVEGSTRVVVQFADGSKVDGVVVGQDPISDVAVVSVDVDRELPVAPLALNEPLVPGQLAVAIGSPFGLDQTITAGIVSNVARPVVGDDGTVRDLIQTDASINPGNSGGALADRQGRVIGINDVIFTRSGGNDGVGFAIPITYAKQIADQLVAGEGVETARLGVSGTDPRIGTAGALITSVELGSPADLAGLEAGDLIVAINDDPVQLFVDLAAAIRGYPPGVTVDLSIMRDGAQLIVRADLVSR